MVYDEGKMREAQEFMAKMVRGGYHKELAKMCRTMYDAFRKESFTKRQALNLTKALFMPGRKEEE